MDLLSEIELVKKGLSFVDRGISFVDVGTMSINEWYPSVNNTNQRIINIYLKYFNFNIINDDLIGNFKNSLNRMNIFYILEVEYIDKMNFKIVFLDYLLKRGEIILQYSITKVNLENMGSMGLLHLKI